MQTSKMKAACAMAAVGIAVSLASSRAHAVAMFSADATIFIDPSSVVLTGGNSYTWLAQTAVSAVGPTTVGTGLITTNTKINTIGWGTQSTVVAGSATGPAFALALLGNETHDHIYVDNFGNAGPAILSFTMTYSASSAVSTTDAGDGAGTDYNIHITGIGDELGEDAEFSIDGGMTWLSILRLKDALTFPASIGPEFQLDVAQSVFGPGGSDSSADAGVVLVRYIVTPDNDNAFSIFTRATGAARAGLVVPEPATGLLALLAAAALGRRRRLA